MAYAGQTAVITGGASGIGKRLAEVLLKGNGRVVIGDINKAAGDNCVKELNGTFGNGRAFFVLVDVTNWDSVEALFAEAERILKRIDLAFANAGIASPGFPDIVGEPDMRTIDINLKGTLYTIQAAVTSMRRNQLLSADSKEPAAAFRSRFRGKIVVTGSITGLYATPCHVIYSSTKHAVWGAVRALGPRLAREHITVNAVAPNLTKTAISPGDYYKAAEAANVVTPMETVLRGFEGFLGLSETTGQISEATGDLASLHKFPDYRDPFTKRTFEVLHVEFGPAETSRVPILQRQAEERLAAKKKAKL